MAERLAASRADAEARGIRVDARLSPVTVLGDGVLLGQLASNLIENAITHNIDAGLVVVRTECGVKEASLIVSNDGKRVPDAQLASLTEPFFRGEGRTVGRSLGRKGRQGHGLGLSLVRSVVDAHGGELAIVARPDGGLDVVVRIPVPS